MFVFFFFKQKTAYEMRISDWSSDVCSSDLARLCGGLCGAGSWLFLEDASPDRCILRFKQLAKGNGALGIAWQIVNDVLGQRVEVLTYRLQEIGRASCRERVCQYV